MIKRTIAVGAGIIMLIATIFGALAFTPYECENVYDNFNDASINYTLWQKVGSGAYGFSESGGELHTTAVSGQWVNVSANITWEEGKLYYPIIGAGGCFKVNLTYLSEAVSNSMLIRIGDQTIYTHTNIPNGVQQEAVVEAWRDRNLIYYRFNATKDTSMTLSNFTPTEDVLYYPQLETTSGGTGFSIAIDYDEVRINNSGIIRIKTFDESTGNNIAVPIKVEIVDNISTRQITVTNWTFVQSYDRTTQIHFHDNAGVYADKTYYIGAPDADLTILDAYLINTSRDTVHLVTFTTYSDTLGLIEGANYIIQKIFGTTVVNISESESNFQGQLLEYMDSSTNYNIIINEENYVEKSFSIYPIESAYNPMLTALSSPYTVFDPLTINFPAWFSNRSMDIQGYVHKQWTLTIPATEIENVSISTDYLATKKYATEISTGLWAVNLTSGTQFNESGTDNITVSIYIDDEYQANITIQYFEAPTEYLSLTDEEKDLLVPLLVFICVITLTAGISRVFQARGIQSDIPIIIFYGLIIAAPLVNARLVWWTVMGVTYIIMKIAKTYISE